MSVKIVAKVALTAIFRNAIKQSLLNNPDIDLNNPHNIDLLTDDILESVGSDMDNILTLLKLGLKL
jgi:hypothetical protein